MPPIANSTHYHTLLLKHIFYFEQLTEDVRRVFPPLGPRKKIMNPSRIFDPLINIRNKNMKSCTHTESPILE